MLQEHKSWECYDSQKLQTYLDCPRKFFLRHRVGWTLPFVSVDIVHGHAMHAAIKKLFEAKGEQRSYLTAVDEAIEAYKDLYGKEIPESEWAANEPKGPNGALRALSLYAAMFDDDRYRLLGTEIFGSVPLPNGGVLLGRLDAVLTYEDGDGKEHVLIEDTKTSKFRFCEEELDMRLQFSIYYLLGKIFTENSDSVFDGVLVDHIRLGSKDCELNRHLIKRTDEQLVSFLDEVLFLIRNIQLQDQVVKTADPDQPLAVFPKNPGNCYKFFKPCEFLDICRFHPRVLRAIETESGRFVVHFWDPREEQEKVEKEEKDASSSQGDDRR